MLPGPPAWFAASQRERTHKPQTRESATNRAGAEAGPRWCSRPTSDYDKSPTVNQFYRREPNIRYWFARIVRAGKIGSPVWQFINRALYLPTFTDLLFVNKLLSI
jgi:hypothetical protein